MIYYLVVILLALSDLFFWWWGDRRLRQLGKGNIWRWLLSVLVGGQFVLLVIVVGFPAPFRPLGEAFWKPVSAWLYMWHLLVLPATLICLLLGYVVIGAWSGLRGLVDRLLRIKPAIRFEAPATQQGGEVILGSVTGPVVLYPSRRQILGAAATFVPQAALGCALMKTASHSGKFRIRRMEIALPHLPPGLSGMTIAHVSDTHVGRFVGPKELEAVVSATAGLKPDLIAFTGDLIDFNLCDLGCALDSMRELQKIAPLAMCVGNHDLFEDGHQFRRRLLSADIGLMLDEAMTVTVRNQKIELLGLDWGTDAVPRADGIDQHMRTLLARRSSAFPILLAHHPHAFGPAAAAGIPLTLSGHTHGGQIMITKSFGAGRVYRYWSGLYEKGGSKLVVSNGVGNWFPLRINAPAEIVHLTLRSV